MKKIIKSGILIFIFIIFLFNFSSNAQIIRDSRMVQPVMDRMFSFEGSWVFFSNESNLGRSNVLMAGMTVNLKDNKYYRLEMVKLNGMKLTFTKFYRGGRWQLNMLNFNCQVGQTLVVTAHLVRKDLRERLREKPKTFRLATYRIPSLINKMEFPHNGMLIDLRQVRSKLLTFKWSFLGTKQNTKLLINKVIGSYFVNKEQSVNYSKILKSVFQPGKEYQITLHSYHDQGESFIFTRFVEPGSKLIFINAYYSRFRTRN